MRHPRGTGPVVLRRLRGGARLDGPGLGAGLGRCPGGRFPGGFFPDDRFAEDRFPDDRCSGGWSPGDRCSGGRDDGPCRGGHPRPGARGPAGGAHR
ncbi:hypothetical protein GCM10017687_78610 [Streptomyces echinatus]